MDFPWRFFGEEELAAAAELVAALPRPPSQTVSIRDFGAVGDGIADDTPALISALKDLGPGSTVLIPPGVYSIGGPDLSVVVEWASCLTIQGAGPCSVLRRRPGGPLDRDRGGGILRFNGGRDIQVRDLAFDAFGYTGWMEEDGGWHQGEVLQFWSSQSVTVSKCRFFDSNAQPAAEEIGRDPPSWKRVAVLFDSLEPTMPNERVRIVDNAFTGLGFLARNVSDCTIAENKFEAPIATAIEFSDHRLENGVLELRRTLFEDISIRNNLIIDPRLDGIVVVALSEWDDEPRAFQRIFIDSNTVVDSRPRSDVRSRTGIRVGFRAEQRTLVSRSISQRNGLEFSDIRVASNNIRMFSSLLDVTELTGGGIAMWLGVSEELGELGQDIISQWAEFQRAEVVGNVISGAPAVGIKAASLSRSRIAGNSIFGFSEDGGCAIWLESLNETLVEDNRANISGGERSPNILWMLRSYGRNVLRGNLEMGDFTSRGQWLRDEKNRHDRYIYGETAALDEEE